MIPLCVYDITIMAAKTVLLLAGQVDESNIRHMCIMGKDVLEVITYKRSVLLELLNLISKNDIELQEVSASYSEIKYTWIATKF